MIVHARTPEQQSQLLAYIAQKIGMEAKVLVGDMPFHAVGAVRDGRLAGVILFLNFRGKSVEFHLCGSPGWLTRGEIRHLFSYAFDTLGCSRLWCTIRRNNKAARRGAERLGFKVLGVAEDEFGEGKDGVMYTMARRHCKWLR